MCIAWFHAMCGDSKFHGNSRRIRGDRGDLGEHVCGGSEHLHLERKGNKVGNHGGMDREAFGLKIHPCPVEGEAGVNREKSGKI